MIYLILGIFTSLVSGLYTQDLTQGAGSLITGYGFPQSWLEKITIVTPGSPSHYSLAGYGLGLILDTIFWFMVIGIIHNFYLRFKK